jgi:PAS domain S-box-containing protein
MGPTMQVNLVPVLLGCTAILNLWIGLFVYLKAPSSSLNRAFGFLAATVSVWTTSGTLAHYGSFGHIWLVRCAFASGSLIPLGIFAFIQSLPADSTELSRTRTCLFTLFGFALCGLSFSPWMVVSVTVEPLMNKAVYGPLHAVFAGCVVLWLSHSIYVLVSKYRKSAGLLRLQIRYLVFAFAIPGGLIILTNLAAPLLFGTSIPGRYGPFFSLLMLALIGHAIIRHRLMDMRVVIRRGVTYLAAFVAAGVILIILLVGSNLVLQDRYQTPLREVVLALAVAVFFSPLKAQIQRAFDRYLYREPYDYQRTIRDSSRALGNTIELPALLAYIVSLVVQTLKCEGVAIYLLNDEAGGLELLAGNPNQHDRFPRSLEVSSALVSKVMRSRETVFLDEIVGGQEGPPAGALQAEFGRLGAEVIVPLIEKEQVIGLVCIGPKRSGDPYFSDDADLLTTLANQSAVAIRNAQTHQRVVQMNEELQKILSTIESGVIAVGPRGRIALFNRAAELLTGIPAPTACGRSVDELPGRLARLLAGTVKDGQSRSQEEFALPDPAGQLVPLVCSTSPLLSPEGATVGAVAVLADLSRLKELEQEKRRAERLASIEAIASGIVHEIRNPLVAIKTFSQLLPFRFQDQEFRETFSRVADREIRRIDDLLTRFRTLSSASAQPMELVNVSGPLGDTLETLGPRLEEHRIQLRLVADGPSRPIVGNEAQLEQLFLNLCLNAIESMEPGGELTVRIADLCDGGGTTLLVEISDTGSGIPENLLAAIFNPFVTTKVQGSGLGLAICRSITDAHHARLAARNNSGRPGATFTIEFPVPAEAARIAP